MCGTFRSPWSEKPPRAVCGGPPAAGRSPRPGPAGVEPANIHRACVRGARGSGTGGRMSEEKAPWVVAGEQVTKEGWKPHPERVNILVCVFTYDKMLHAD